ncbi:Rpn family recombination-promoting nuclease/putative transposase [Desulfobacterales bacterium HSG2]|nr:Rpn family recombination-promoting nuclease/putative transposase [Desulfobacterales bacterium HSG2]
MKNKIKPTVDCVVKAMFGKEENRNLLINFLNAVLEPDAGERITDVFVLNPYNEREFESGKLSIVDIKARDEGGRYFQVEIQVSAYFWLALRMLHNWAGVYHAQLEKGKPYVSLNPVISIWILDDMLFSPSEKEADTDNYLHLIFEPRERALGIRMTDHFAIHILQLPCWDPQNSVTDDRERWIHFFREGENMDADNLPEGMNTEEIRQAMGVLERFSDNRDEHILYLSRLDAARQMRTWEIVLEQKELELREKDSLIKRKDSQLKRKDSQLKQKDSLIDQERREKEQAQKEMEQAQKERERLAALLKKAGIRDEHSESD